jgi:hypothetical protein
MSAVKKEEKISNAKLENNNDSLSLATAFWSVCIKESD